MSNRDKREFLTLLESMTVESAKAGSMGQVDVLVGGAHVARAEYLPRLDQFTVDTLQGEFAL